MSMLKTGIDKIVETAKPVLNLESKLLGHGRNIVLAAALATSAGGCISSSLVSDVVGMIGSQMGYGSNYGPQGGPQGQMMPPGYFGDPYQMQQQQCEPSPYGQMPYGF